MADVMLELLFPNKEWTHKCAAVPRTKLKSVSQKLKKRCQAVGHKFNKGGTKWKKK